MTPTMTPSDSYPGKPAVELSMGQRQIAALGFLAFLLLGFVATVAYLAGRVAGPGHGAPVTAKHASTPPSTAQPQPSSPAIAVNPASPGSSSTVQQLILVEPAAPDRSASILAAKAAEPTKAPSLVQTKTPELKPVAGDLLAGSTFWQVAATELGMSEVTCEFLTRKGIPSLISDGPSAGVYRVLVGPIHNPDESQRYKNALDQAGFHPFLKKY